MKLHRQAATLLIAGAFASSTLLAARVQQQGKAAEVKRGVPAGSLGRPFGDYLTIEGITTTEEASKLGSYLIVSKVNGKALAEEVGIHINGFDTTDFPRPTRCILKGYETGEMVGQPPAVAAAAREAGRKPPLGPPTSWHFARHFVVLSVVSPDEPLKPKTKD